jgi:8-oxo-dGTP pyrophosphatase MutT (NUDIX family)
VSSSSLLRALDHPDVRRLASALAARPGAEAQPYDGVRHAAVALALRAPEGGRLELLMVKRAEFEGDPWSGHVALPGGRREPADASLEDTAVRETWEETGLDIRRDGRILGSLDELSPRTPSLPPIIIRPYVAVVAEDVAIVPSDEFAAAFWVLVDRLRDPNIRIETTVEVRGGELRVMAYRYQGYTVWGLTERILHQFLALIG